MKVRQAYEVYSLVGGGYAKRHVHGYAWTHDDAETIATRVTPRRAYTGIIHVVQINGNWHRISVLPIPDVKGNIEHAAPSRIELGNLPTRVIPGMFAQIGERDPIRLGLDIESNVNTIAEQPKAESCKLYTTRMGGELPLVFNVAELHSSEVRQAAVFAWLQAEINYRKSQGE